MSKNTGPANKGGKQPQQPTKPQTLAQYDEDTDTDDENNSSVINDRQGGTGSQGNAQTLKKEVKNYKKCRKMYFFLTAMVGAPLCLLTNVGACLPDKESKGHQEQLPG